LTKSQGRKFGLTVGIAFLALTALLLWRQRETIAYVTGTLGGLLVLGGLVIPTKLGPVERAWMAMAHKISKVTTPIVMGIVYFIVIAPIGLGREFLGGEIERQGEDRRDGASVLTAAGGAGGAGVGGEVEGLLIRRIE
jgi:hypothetical protein